MQSCANGQSVKLMVNGKIQNRILGGRGRVNEHVGAISLIVISDYKVYVFEYKL